MADNISHFGNRSCDEKQCCQCARNHSGWIQKSRREQTDFPIVCRSAACNAEAYKYASMFLLWLHALKDAPKYDFEDSTKIGKIFKSDFEETVFR